MEKSMVANKINWQWVLSGLLAVVFVVVVILNRDNFIEALNVLKTVDTKYVIILPLLQLFGYMWIAGYYKSMFNVFKVFLSYWDAYRMTAGLYFIEQVLPSGGAANTAYIAYGLKDRASASLSTLVQLGRYGFNHMGYVAVMVIATFLAVPSGDTKLIFSGLIFTTLLFLVAVFGFYLVLKDEHINTIVEFFCHRTNWFAKKILRRKKNVLEPKKIIKSLEEFHDGAKLVKNDKRQFLPPFLIMFVSALMQILVVYFSFLSLGADASFSIIVFAFAFANVFGVLSIIPGDIGVHETAMIAACSYFGVEVEDAIAATLIYRVFNKFIMVGIGFIFYSHFLKPGKSKTKATKK